MNKETIFMKIDEIGTLTIYDVLLSYIYPRVFVCMDEFECRYLFYEIESDDDHDIWLVTKLKKQEYYSLVDKERPVQYIYRKATGINLFAVAKHYDQDDRIEYISDGSKYLQQLPKEDVFAEKDIVDSVSEETLKAAREA